MTIEPINPERAASKRFASIRASNPISLFIENVEEKADRHVGTVRITEIGAKSFVQRIELFVEGVED